LRTHKSLAKTATVALALATVTSSAYGQKSWNAPHIVTTYCSGCHGVNGKAQLPYFPNLATLDPAYAEKKLAAFNETSPHVDELYWWILRAIGDKKQAGVTGPNERINMEGVAHAVKPEVMNEAVKWYAKQPPVPGHSANKALIEEGRVCSRRACPLRRSFRV
jgi:cytochrome c553